MQFNPDGSHALTGALAWLADLLTGRLGTVVAVLAIGWIGMLMLQGRIEWRRAAMAVAGAFLLFGAPSIARGLMDTATAVQPRRPPPIPPAPVATPNAPPQFDPYAGAALPH